jgi:hypothetical protein
MSKSKDNEITIIFTSDHESAQNVEALDFFRGVLPDTVKEGFFINFLIAYESEKEKYDKLGIKSFPAAVFNKNVFSTIAKIKELFNVILKKNKSFKKASSDEDEIGSYFKKEILTKEEGEDDDDSEYSTIEADRAKKMQSEIARRKIPVSGQKATPVPRKPRPVSSIKAGSSTNTSTADVLLSISGRDADDALMAKFYDNLEETVI